MCVHSNNGFPAIFHNEMCEFVMVRIYFIKSNFTINIRISVGQVNSTLFFFLLLCILVFSTNKTNL